MNLNEFPSTPYEGQQLLIGNVTYQYTGGVWNVVSAVKTNLRVIAERLAKEAGFSMVAGSFDSGATITNPADVIWDEFSGKYYSWSCAFPKVVAAGSTPATSGGTGVGAWADKTDLMLRSELFNNYNINSTTLEKLNGMTVSHGQLYSIEDRYCCVHTIVDPYIIPGLTPDGYSVIALDNGLYSCAYYDGATSYLSCGATPSKTAYSDDAVKSCWSLAGSLGLRVDIEKYPFRTKTPVPLLDNKTYFVKGKTPVFRRYRYTDITNINSCNASVWVNTESDMLSLGNNTVIHGDNVAYIGSEADRTPGAYYFARPKGVVAETNYWKGHFFNSEFFGFAKALDYSNGAYVQTVKRCRFENNDYALDAGIFANGSVFSENSFAYNRKHATFSGDQYEVCSNEVAFDSQYDEAGFNFIGTGYKAENNYMEIPEGSSTPADWSNGGAGVIPVQWVIRPFVDFNNYSFQYNKIDCNLKTRHAVKIIHFDSVNNVKYAGTFRNNALVDSTSTSIDISGGSLMALPRLSDDGQVTVSGTYKVLEREYNLRVLPDGTLANGDGLTVSKTATGTYVFTFDQACVSGQLPTVSAICFTGGNTFARITALNESAFTLTTYNITSSAPVDATMLVNVNRSGKLI